jgi:outer membrane receptor protein involved in Fe transport
MNNFANKKCPSRHSVLAVAIAQLIGFGMVGGVLAADNEKATLEEVVVVGSRIKRQDEVSSSPVQTLSEEDLRLSGSLSMGEILQQLPSVGSSLNSNGSAGTSHGSSSLNMRNLGENRSLVLVNGQRWVNGAGTRGFRDFVDLNTIPQAIVERVEVLQDGATAIYGADAIAGVVNIHTYKSFEGARVTGTWGQSDEGDRETSNIDFLWGKNIGASNWMLAVTYVDQDPIYTQDRALTAVPLNGLTFGTPEGVFTENNLAGVTTGGATKVTRDAGVDGSVVGNWRASVSATDRYNRYDNNYVSGPLERTSIYLQNTTALSDTVELRAEVLYNQRKSDQQFSSVPAGTIRGSRGFVIANDPLVNPFGVEFSGSDFRIDNFFVDNGYRKNVQDVETLRFGVGLNGELDNGWSWDAFASWAENEATFTSQNQIHLDKLALGLLACNSPSASADLLSGCVPVNLFAPLTQAMVDYIDFTGHDTNKAKQTNFTFNITGDFYDLPAGPIAFAAGLERRQEQGSDVPDSTSNSDPALNAYRTTTSAPRDGTEGKYDLNEMYVEFSLPLLQDQPLAKELTLDIATRYSDYSTFGDTTNSKVGLGYRPTENLLIRGTWAEGFRAPSIVEMYEGIRATSVPVSDPCNGGGAGLVGCVGVPDTHVQLTANVPATVGGNPDLQPETSDNISFGLVYTPDFLEGSSLTVDWYNIKLEDTISSFGAQDLLNLCATAGQRCAFISRDATGEISNVTDGPINLNSKEVKGVDIVARYSMDTRLGDLDMSLSASRLLDLTEVSTLADGTVKISEKVGTAASRASYPKWRSGLSAKLNNDRWSVNYSARLIGETTETVSNSPRDIGTVVYHNISGRYSVSDQFSLKMGADNVGDKQPPVSLTNLNINFDQNTYTAVGRYLYLQATYDF